MATFGALSEREMAMAMRTNLDPNLDGQELVDFIRESIDAKKKLATVLYERSLALNKGSGSYQEWQDETASKMVTHNKHRYEKLNKSQIKGFNNDNWKEIRLDIDSAVNIFKKNDCSFELMHCVSTYPCPEEILNLNIISKLISS